MFKNSENWQIALSLLVLVAFLTSAVLLSGCSTTPVAQPVVRLPDPPQSLQKPLPPLPVAPRNS